MFASLASGCSGGTSKPPAWVKSLPEASVMGSWRGLQPARGIIHLHSPYSHDACDNKPRDPLPLGAPNEPCLDDLRYALCTDHIDFAALTDHDDTMADEDFPTLFSMRGTDQPVLDPVTGTQIASRMTCDDGHVVTITVGGENTLMPIMLHEHVAGTVQERHDTYNADTADAVTAYRAAGGLAWVAHTEQHAIDELRTVQPDGIEVYNLHANIDPNIRSMWLGLPSGDAIAAALKFADTNPGHPEPDLALLGFVSPNLPAIDRWNQLLGDGKHIPATAGSDAHENVLPVILADGERGDSYRRVLRWFANIAIVDDPQDPGHVQAAVKAGQLFAVFELLGTPEGFDIHATTAGGATVELGGTVAVTDNATLTVGVPRVLGLDRGLPAPEIHTTILRIDASGPAVVGTGEGPEVTAALSQPGAYRVEISMVPRHLAPYLGDLGPADANAEVPWIYASPIYVQ